MNGLRNRISYRHRGGDRPLIGRTIPDYLGDVAERFAEREAVVSMAQGIRLTYAQLDFEVQRLARGLIGLGVARGDRVAIWSTNNVEWLMLQLAAARVGAILVSINPAYRRFELEHALRLAKVQTIFLIPSFRKSAYLEMVRELCGTACASLPADFAPRELPDLRRVIVYDPDRREPIARPEPAFLTWSDVLECGTHVRNHRLEQRELELDPDDPVSIQLTSGTTGAPKAVMLTHHNLLNNGFFVGEALRFTEHDRLCVPVPFYHCFGMVVANLACLTHGAAVVIPAAHFDPVATLAAVSRERCTALHGVPTMFVALLERPELRETDRSRLRTGIMGGAPCPPELVRRVVEELGCPEILVAYGQTESSPITNVTRPDDPLEKRAHTVGTNLPHQEIEVVDPGSGGIVPTGEQGEICFRGYHVMKGYYGQPEATRQAVDADGWLHSGDLGVMDDDGYLRITGRLKDMIIRGGENIYPAEIEAFFFEHPKVAQVAVFGIPDEILGEEVGAWITLHEGMTGDPEEFREHARRHLAHYKVPRHIWLVDEFPMTATGKIQKFRIREIAVELIARGAHTTLANAHD